MTESLKHISVFALLGMILAGCDGAHDMPGTIGNPVAAEITARIGAASRASGTIWEDDDRIGISGVSGKEAYVNEEYRIADRKTGRFTAVGAGIFYQTTAPVTFTAYYPFTGSAAPGQAPVITGNTRADSQTAAAQPGIDYLWAQASGDYKTPVDFTFHHRMSRLSLTFTNGEGIDVSEMTAYSVEGLKMTGTFDTATGTASATGAAETLTISDPSLTSLILYPQATGGNMKIKTVIAGQSYSCMPEITELKPGVDYAYTIRVSKTGLTVSSCTISDWNDGGNTEIELNPVVLIGNKKASEAAIGDFYMNDGSLVDKDATLTDVQKAACIGIVFSTDPARIGEGARAALTAKGVAPHGLVMALTNASSDKPSWSTESINEPELTETDNLQKMYQNIDGYTETNRIIARYNTLVNGYRAFYFASRYGVKGTDTEKYAAPDKSTGWFMPSTGQWWDIMRNLGGVTVLDNYKDDSSRTYIRLDNQGRNARGNINSRLSKIPGSTSIGKDDDFWTSSEFDNENACGVSFISDGSFYFIKNYKSMLIYYVRCVLAF